MRYNCYCYQFQSDSPTSHFISLHKYSCQGSDLDTIAAACVLATIRINRLGRPIDRVAEYARTDVDEIGQTYRWLNEEFGIPAPPPKPEEYLGSIASAVGLEQAVCRTAKGLIDELSTQFLMGRNPAGVAAGALYRAALEHSNWTSQETIAEQAGVTPVTLRNTVKALEDSS